METMKGMAPPILWQPHSVRLVGALCVVGIFCLFAFFSQRDMNRLTTLREHGVVGGGTVTGRRQNVGGGRRAFGIYYRFEAGRKSYEGHWPVSERYHAQASVGTLLQVTYLPTDPRNHYIGQVDHTLIAQRRNNQIIGMGIVAAFSSLLLTLLFRAKQ